MVVEVNLVPTLVEAHDVVFESSGSAASSLETVLQKFSDPQLNPGLLHRRARVKNMPEICLTNMCE